MHARAAVPTTHHDAPRRVLIRCCVPFVCSARSRLGIFISSSTTSPHSWSRCARSASSSRPSLGVGSGGTGIPSLAASVLIGASTRRRVSMASAGALTCVVYTFSLSDLFSASLLLYLVCAHTSLLLFLMTSSMHQSTHVLCGVVRRWRHISATCSRWAMATVTGKTTTSSATGTAATAAAWPAWRRRPHQILAMRRAVAGASCCRVVFYA